MRKYNVGDIVLTIWDDTDEIISGVIVNSYRGHRNRIYIVATDIITFEKVYDYQIILAI
jgi:hypothetical protein